MRILGVTVAFALCLGSAAWADDAGLVLPPGWFVAMPNVKAKPVDAPAFRAVMLGKNRVVFEKSRLADVMAAASGGKIKHRGDAGESVYWLCYRFEQNGATRQLYVKADGEMGGFDHAVGGIVLLDKTANEADCPVLSGKLLPVRLDQGLGIGSDYADFVRRFGPPQGRNGDKAHWLFERKTRLPDSPEDWFVLQSVAVEFRQGKAAILAVDQSTSD